MPSIAQMAEQLHKERAAIAAIFEAAKQEDGTYNLSAEEVGALHKRGEDLTVLQKQHDDAVALEGMHRDVKGALGSGQRTVPGDQPGQQPGSTKRVRSWDEIVASAAGTLKEIAKGGRGSVTWTMSDAEYKTLLTLSNISPQESGAPGSAARALHKKTTAAEPARSRRPVHNGRKRFSLDGVRSYIIPNLSDSSSGSIESTNAGGLWRSICET